MEHTFVRKEGKWKGHGILIDEDKLESIVECRYVISAGEKWRLACEMSKREGGKKVIESELEFAPPQSGPEYVEWKRAGDGIKGRFMVAGDTIVSSYEKQGREGESGLEFYAKVNDECYMDRGAVFRDGNMVRCWVVELTAG